MGVMHRRNVFYSRGFLGAAVLAAFALVAAPVASAQDPAAVSQYVAQQPTVGGNSGSGGGGDGTEGGLGSQGGGGTDATGTAGENAQSGGSGGSLPFTGYPLTSYLWIVISFVLAGLCVRAAVAYQRRQGIEPQGS